MGRSECSVKLETAGVSLSESEADEAGDGKGVAEFLAFEFKELIDGYFWVFHKALLQEA